MRRHPHAERFIRYLPSLILVISASTAAFAVPSEVRNLGWCPGPKDCIQWDSVAGATEYRVYRGGRPSLPCVLGPALDSCDHGTVFTTSTGATVAETPAAGEFFWFLVTAADPGGEGTYGFASAGPRESQHNGACAASCSPSGAGCSASGNCCSASCIAATCQTACCVGTGAVCTQHSDCCSGTCSGGLCQAPCTPNGGVCASGGQCCSGSCAGSACQCTPIGNACTTNAQCCSGTCSGGICQSYCGDGVVNPGEHCDDHNNVSGDGCSAACTGETGYFCLGSPSVCAPCAAGLANCNLTSADGCEVSLATDSQNCGSCGLICPGAPNAVGTCSGSACGFACALGFANCNGIPGDGCECNGNICCSGGCEPLHANGLGQSFDSCDPTGVPGNAATYTATLAALARAAWPFAGIDFTATCGTGPSASQAAVRQTANSCAVWVYQKTLAGYVRLNSANNTCLCPSNADPTWY